jgi:ComF family protein
MGAETGWGVGVREGALKQLLDRYKFDSAREAGRVCAQLLEERLPVLPFGLTVVPVPTSPKHRRARGFDHTLYIAKAFAKHRSLACRQSLRKRGGGTQHFYGRTERLEQAESGLEVVGSAPSDILLIDDIYTTGATIRACVRQLRRAGAKRIFVAIIARQTLDGTSDLW